ncbi:uncharacterized protein [Epargyreus clarus]|uniref:uncharacterized protein n=1 Tax=Epargyreus clarus TaxID=520877 RepID=UPI003C2BC1C6
MNRKRVVKPRKTSDILCLCKNETELEYLTATPGCSEDLAAVCALPEKWIPRKRGNILNDYLKKREESHQNIFEDLLKDSKALNEETDSKVRILANILLAAIKQNQRDIDCVVEKCTPSENPLTNEDRKNALTDINTLLSRRIQDITNFKIEALALERGRATALKSTLQLHFQQFIAVGCKAPKELLHEFDEKIYDINQQVMSNSRSYMMLEAKLRSQADKNLVDTRSALNQKFLVITPIWRERSAQPWFRDQKQLNRSTSAHEHGQSNRSDIDQSMQQIDGNKSQSKLVGGYREAILHMLKSISGQIDKLNKEIRDHNVISRECSASAVAELQSNIEKAIRLLGINTLNDEILNRDLIQMSRTNIVNMQNSLLTFGDNLRDTYAILHDAVHLLDAHMVRLGLAQKLMMAAVEDLIVNHDAAELSNEIITDIALEQLRTAPDADKLQQYYDVITVGLDRTFDLYMQHNDVEFNKLQEFTDLNSPLTSMLLAEYNLFLEKNPRSPFTEIKSAVNTPLTETPRNPVTAGPVQKAIFQTAVQNVALCNWKNGFLESFESNLSTVSDQLNQQTQLWVDERSDILRTRQSLKLMSHSIRKERILCARNRRLAEIRYHEDRLNSHLDAIYDLVDNLPMEASEFLSIDSPELYPLGWWLSKIHTDMNELFARDPLDPEVKRLKMCSYASRLLKHRQLFSDSLDSALEQYRKNIQYRVQVARIANVRFMSQLKLYGEGGKYAASEALKTCTALIRGADSLEPCVTRTLDCVNHRRSQLLNLADQLITPLQKMVDEVLKNAPKGFLDKRKLVTGKR